MKPVNVTVLGQNEFPLFPNPNLYSWITNYGYETKEIENQTLNHFDLNFILTYNIIIQCTCTVYMYEAV